jgi:hypothetical protein
VIIKDVKGKKLNLSKTRLREVRGMADPYPCWVVLSELRAVVKAGINEVQLHCSICPQGNCIKVNYSPETFTIGCRTFSPETFMKILKAAGVKPVRKTKPAKKARRAKN